MSLFICRAAAIDAARHVINSVCGIEFEDPELAAKCGKAVVCALKDLHYWSEEERSTAHAPSQLAAAVQPKAGPECATHPSRAFARPAKATLQFCEQATNGQFDGLGAAATAVATLPWTNMATATKPPK